jgi:hypothetical protein
VPIPPGRPPRSVFLIVNAVSGPGATITMIETPRNVSNELSIRAALPPR